MFEKSPELRVLNDLSAAGTACDMWPLVSMSPLIPRNLYERLDV